MKLTKIDDNTVEKEETITMKFDKTKLEERKVLFGEKITEIDELLEVFK